MNSNNRTSILLIEDNPGDAKLIKLLLAESSVKHELFQTDTLFDGLEILKAESISLVLLDLTLPDSSGFKTLSNFLEKSSSTPVIVLTGVNNEIVGNQAIKAGAQDFLVKGQFDGKLLGRSIRYSMQRFKTQLKLEEVAKDLAISEKRYVEAQEMAHFGNWEIDIVSNEMKWSDEVYRVFGFNPNSFNPSLSNYLNYVHLEDKAGVSEFFEQAAKDSHLHRIEHRIVVGGKIIKHVAIQAKVYFEEINGKILLLGAIQDITERKLSEQLIIEKNMSSKVSKIKEEALADMSFHIRTPLSSIVNLLFLLDKTAISSQQTEFLDGLKTSVDDLSIMVNNLLNFSVLVSDQMTIDEEEISLTPFFTSIQKVLQIKANNAKVELNLQVDKACPEKMITDNNKLTQILFNLIDDTIKNTKAGTALQVAIETEAGKDGKHTLKVNILDPQRLIEPEDIKQLMSSEKLLEVYQEDHKEEIEKEHLGIAIASKLTKVLKGTFELSSTTEGGSNYQITIPVGIPMQAKVFSGDKPDMPIKILMVEDHFLNQIATKRVLTTWSPYITVDIAENGLIGVEKFFEHGYDIILMDLQMPVMGGLEASRKIREKSTVPIIAMTANSSKQEADNCYKSGINEYMSKPFKPEDLYSKILSLLVGVPG